MENKINKAIDKHNRDFHNSVKFKILNSYYINEDEKHWTDINLYLKSDNFKKTLSLIDKRKNSGKELKSVLLYMLKVKKIKIDVIADISSKSEPLIKLVENTLKYDLGDMKNLEQFYLILQQYEKLFFHHLDNYYKARYLNIKNFNLKSAKNILVLMSAKLNNSKDKKLSDLSCFDIDFYKVLLEDLEKFNELKTDLMLGGVIDNRSILDNKIDNNLTRELKKSQIEIDRLSYDCPIYSLCKCIIKVKDSEFLKSKCSSKGLNLRTATLQLIRLRTFAESNDPSSIDIFADIMSPQNCELTYKEIIDLCMEYHFDDLATKYERRLGDEFYLYKLRVLEYYKMIDVMILTICQNTKDKERIERIRFLIEKYPDKKDFAISLGKMFKLKILKEDCLIF